MLAPQYGVTLLYAASRNGHLEVVEALLAKGADVHTKDEVSFVRACTLCPLHSLKHMQSVHGYL